MSEKRRDNRGRILHNGEIQKADGPYSNMPIKQEDENDTTLVRYREVARSLQEF